MRTIVSGAGIAAVLFGALVAPAGAAPSKPDSNQSRAVKGAVVTPGKAVTDLPAQAKGLNAEDPYFCFRGHVQNVGWQEWDCDNGPDAAADAGTTGRDLRLEAIQIIATGTGGLTCADAHVQNIGWQGERCVQDGLVLEVGTSGQSLRVEALFVGSTVLPTCAEGHVQFVGWQGPNCQPVGFGPIVGTEGQGLRLEAVRATIRQKP
ncbi:hypothetical protein ACSHWB_13160 [Lentzea sp. HUAS TT2]|uniref:hypothetical protein n=1 Tax=Lentzea sp. HUAS TT2 TaxID=3447454 RepID=UPI003F6EED1E